MIDINRIVMTEARIDGILNTVFIRINKRIAPVNQAVLIRVNLIVMTLALILRIKHTVLVGVVNAAITVTVPWQCIRLWALVGPSLNVSAGCKGASCETRVVSSVLSYFEDGVGL